MQSRRQQETASMRIAILDDYQGWSDLFDWSAVSCVQVVSFRDHVVGEKQLIDRLAGFHGVMRIRERTVLTRRVLEGCPELRLVLATGARNASSIDLRCCAERGITVCTTGSTLQTTTEIVWFMILDLMRGCSREMASMRAGGWQVGVGRGLAGRTLGVLGLGNLGAAVARIGHEFGMTVLAWSPNLTAERAAKHGAEFVEKGSLFSRSDIVTVHMPLAETTKGLVGRKELERMKPGSFLINTARAAIVDNAALIEFVVSGRIAGAGLDVFEIEPLPVDHPFRTLPNVVATPHIGFVTEDNYRTFFEQAVENLAAYRAGAPIRTITADNPTLAGSSVR
jgi:phosphoglycerate dehydrogenase-like enzyme